MTTTMMMIKITSRANRTICYESGRLLVSSYFSWCLWTSHGVSCWQPRGWALSPRAATNSGLSFPRWSSASASASASARSSSGLSSHRGLGSVPPWSLLHQPRASQLPGLSEHHGRRWQYSFQALINHDYITSQNFPPHQNHVPNIERGSVKRATNGPTQWDAWQPIFFGPVPQLLVQNQAGSFGSQCSWNCCFVFACWDNHHHHWDI